MRVGPDVIAVLDRCTFDGPRLLLAGQLTRGEYVAVNKVIETAGGKWAKREKAHLFDGDAEGIIDQVILAGEVTSAKQALGFFETPPAVIDRLIELAELEPGHTVLEPSAGLGAIVNAVHAITGHVAAVETDEKRAGELVSQGVAAWVAEADFLTIEAHVELFDRVVMNPPFARQQDIDHVIHALGFLKPGGLLVSVMSVSVTFRQNRKADDFRKLVADRGGWFEELPEDAFKPSGTGVHTVIAVIPGESA